MFLLFVSASTLDFVSMNFYTIYLFIKFFFVSERIQNKGFHDGITIQFSSLYLTIVCFANVDVITFENRQINL